MKRVRSVFVASLFLILAVQAWATPFAPVMNHAVNGLNLSVSWTEVPNVSGYTLYYAPYPYEGAHTIGHLEMGNKNNFSINLWVGASYYITVTSHDDFGESPYSNIRLFTIDSSVNSQATFDKSHWDSGAVFGQ